MANPQKENGYIPIAKEIMQAMQKTHWTEYEIRVIFCIFEKTYGWHKKEDWISLSQLAKMTGILSHHIARTITKLKKRNILLKNKNKLKFNKDYDQWDKLLPKQVVPNEVVPNEVGGSTQRGSQVVPNEVHTKDTITKDTIQKILNFYILSFKEIYNTEPEVDKNDFILVERVLKKYPPPEIKEIINYYKDSEKCQKYKYKLSVALSKDTINDYILYAKATN
jgi:phage replication O-like protein O